MKRWEMGWGWKSLRETRGEEPSQASSYCNDIHFPVHTSFWGQSAYLFGVSIRYLSSNKVFLFPCLCIPGPSSPSALLRYNWHKTFLCKLKVYTVEIWDTYCKIFTTVTVNTAITSHNYHFVVVIHYHFCIISPSVHVLLFGRFFVRTLRTLLVCWCFLYSDILVLVSKF